MSWGLPSNLNTANCCIFLLWDYPLPCPFITTPFVYKTTLIEVVKSTFQPSGPSFGNSFARRSSAVSTKALDVRAPGLERFASLQGLYVNVVMVLGVVVVVFVVVVLAGCCSSFRSIGATVSVRTWTRRATEGPSEAHMWLPDSCTATGGKDSAWLSRVAVRSLLDCVSDKWQAKPTALQW